MNSRKARKQFIESTLKNSLNQDAQHVQLLINQYIEGEIPLQEIYKQLREAS